MKSHEKGFFAHLTRAWIPALASEGFTGSPWSFQRRRDPYIDVVSLQIRKDHNACCVNLGVHLKFLPAPSGKLPDLSNLDQADCEIKVRLAPAAGDLDFWWEFGTSERQALTNASDLVDTWRRRGSPCFGRFVGLPGPFGTVSPEHIANGKFADLLPIGTKVRAALLLARIHQYLGNAVMAQEFARVGLENAGMAVGPRRALREILES